MGHTTQPSLDDTTKKTVTTGSADEPDKLQGIASVPGVVDEVTRVVDHKAERRLCRRFDIRLLPILAVMCKSQPFLLFDNTRHPIHRGVPLITDFWYF